MLYLEIPGRTVAYLILLVWAFWGFLPALWFYSCCLAAFTEDEFFDEDGEYSIFDAMTYDIPAHDHDIEDMDCVIFLVENLLYYDDKDAFSIL